MTISLCMIVKNEAQTLPRCLDSVQDWVDEVVIIDTGSEDATMAIAEERGAIVHSVEWTEDFAAARNESLKYATQDWILVMDADETLTDRGRDLLRTLRTEDEICGCDRDSLLAVNLLRHEVDALQAPYSELSRLFRNGLGLHFQRPYHETIDDSVTRLMEGDRRWQVALWPHTALTHTGYGADAIAQQNKFERAERIMAAYLAQHPTDAYICNKLGALYGSLGNWDAGRSLLERGLAAQPGDASTRYELHYHLGLAYRMSGLMALAVDHYQKALQQPIAPVLKVGAHINLGSLYQARQEYPRAISEFNQAIAAAPTMAIAHYNLGIAKRNAGDLQGAIAAYRTAISLDPDYAAAYQNMAVALFKLGQMAESIEAFQSAIALYRQTDPAAAEQLLNNVRNLGISA